jgi:hypothetical protein
MGTAGRKIGIGVMSVGLALVGAGVLAGGVSAQEQTPIDEHPTCEADSLVVAWANVDLADLSDESGQTFSDGSVSVVLSNPEPIPGHELSLLTVASLDFSASRVVDGVIMQLWEQPAQYDYTLVPYDPAVSSGSLVSPEGSHPDLGQAPIKGLAFCYEKPLVTTTTVAATSTAAPTTTVAATSTAAPTTVAPTTTIGVEVLPEVITAPEEIAFTGSSSGPLVTFGAVLVLLGFALVAFDRFRLTPRGRHSR